MAPLFTLKPEMLPSTVTKLIHYGGKDFFCKIITNMIKSSLKQNIEETVFAIEKYLNKITPYLEDQEIKIVDIFPFKNYTY